jgi:hypothetical protein
MTCTHVLGLIDAGSFADYSRAHLDAAWEHARQCATCGPALRAATALTAELGSLPQPSPPPDLTAAILARVARIEAATPAPAAMMEARAPSVARDWSSWATALGGVATGLAIVWSTLRGDGAPIDNALPGVHGITAGLVAMPSTTTGALVLAAGLVLYTAGLFAPLGDRSRP